MIKKYKLFLESNSNFSIYDYYEYLKEISWKKDINESEFISHIEHFIGKGQWLLISEHFNKIFVSLENVDIDYINDRLKDVFDEYLELDLSYAIRCILYGDYDNYNRDVRSRYNGMMSVKEITNNIKLIMICEFLRNMLSDVLWVSSYRDRIMSRTSNDEMYVTSDEWSIKNLSKQKLELENKKIESEYSKEKYLKFQKEFSVEKYLDMFRPGIYVTVGTSQFMGAKFSHNKIKNEFESVLPSILPDLGFEDVIWPYKVPQDKEDIEIYEFDFKILLKM